MKIEKKYLNIMGISLITVVIYSLINNKDQVMGFFDDIFKHFTVFIIGIVIAFLLNPVLSVLERRFKLTRKKALAFIYFGLILILILCIAFVIPKLVINLTDFVQNFPETLKSTQIYLEKITIILNAKFPFLNLKVDKEHIELLNNYLKTIGQDLLKILGANLLSLTFGFIQFCIGFVMSIFFLGEKEYFRNLIVEVIRVNLPKEKAEKINFYGQKLYEIFMGYLQGKTLESILIGFIAFIGLLYFKVPYAVLLWVFITCTNFVPYFGPFIGMLVTVTVAAFTFPQKIIPIAVFLLILQQIDSWIFEPRIIGDKINLKVFWGLAAITVGGSIAGPVGIVIAAPLASFIKTMYKMKKDEVEKIEENKE